MSSALWGPIGFTGIGAVFLRYGFTRKPLEFNALNLIRMPLPVWAARLIYLPIGLLFIGFGIREFSRLLLK